MRVQRILRVALLAVLAATVLLSGTVAAARPFDPTATRVPATGPADSGDLLRHMAGTWTVRQRLWAGPGSDPVDLPPAVAERRLVNDAYLEEVMTESDGSDPFTRHALLSYNKVTQNYEYVSIDSRAPQAMAYPTSWRDGSDIWFTLADHFVIPEWGGEHDVAFKGRLQLQPSPERQVVRLYWTKLSGERSDEFVAMEYIYTRS